MTVPSRAVLATNFQVRLILIATPSFHGLTADSHS